MTRVTYREYYDKTLLISEGHTGFSSYGQDIVCAGVSTIIFTLLNMLLDEEAAGNVRLIRNIVRDGYLCLEIEKLNKFERIEAIVDFAVEGLLMLQDSYPQNIKME